MLHEVEGIFGVELIFATQLAEQTISHKLDVSEKRQRWEFVEKGVGGYANQLEDPLSVSAYNKNRL